MNIKDYKNYDNTHKWLRYNFGKATKCENKELNILKTSIANCLAGRAKTAGGYYWKYA